ncbi:pirin family protein [Pseudomonas sp. CDFA 602]|uniref:pirin family protein n=1 Tax=Pseudomonas californiensis TaxID=2829823 RepID=UPI001E2C5A69|nr:pirin family protein [Pseudomonas californiensis]MCD5994858.1 pirin family protein [Pseudomonas californiensis]MCD6000511.1 pirin family protein [Pseudomonas californiensis]
MNSTLATPLRTQARTIIHRTRGNSHGPITRLMSPGDLGQRLKPFVFLDLVDLQPKPGQLEFGMHPHSGIATLTYLIEGQTTYEDTTGKSGVLPAGGVEWMSAGNGVWHDGGPVDGSPIKGFQLWVALPPSQENAPPYSVYLEPLQIPEEGPATVLLGRYGAARSSIPAPNGMNYLAVRLKDGERWRYTPPAGHAVGWIAVNEGQVEAGGLVTTGELAVFEESDRSIDFLAKGTTSFVLGSAVKHPHDLVMGYYSVHTSKQALAKGEQEIQRIAAGLRQEGRLR